MRTGLILMNESSGSDGVSSDELATLFPGSRIEVFDAETYAKTLDAALADRVRFVGVAGGDGTIRSVAQELRGRDAALLPIPTGTRNHFARTLSIDDLDVAAATAGPAGTRDTVDVGELNARYFLNNAGIGLYADLVVQRDQHERTLPKPVANVVAAWQQLRRGRRISVRVGGIEVRAWMVFVGNGCYGDGVADLVTRGSLTANVLDVRVVRADRRAARLRVLGALLFGRLGRSPLILCQQTDDVMVELTDKTIEVALDGEVEEFSSPLHFRSLPRALVVLRPRANA